MPASLPGLQWRNGEGGAFSIVTLVWLQVQQKDGHNKHAGVIYIPKDMNVTVQFMKR